MRCACEKKNARPLASGPPALAATLKWGVRGDAHHDFGGWFSERLFRTHRERESLYLVFCNGFCDFCLGAELVFSTSPLRLSPLGVSPLGLSPLGLLPLSGRGSSSRGSSGRGSSGRVSSGNDASLLKLVFCNDQGGALSARGEGVFYVCTRFVLVASGMQTSRLARLWHSCVCACAWGCAREAPRPTACFFCWAFRVSLRCLCFAEALLGLQ